MWATLPSSPEIVRAEFASGWITFENETERRRLAPVPADWRDATDEACGEWLARAMVVSAPSRDMDVTTGTARQPVPPTVETVVARARAVIKAVDAANAERG